MGCRKECRVMAKQVSDKPPTFEEALVQLTGIVNAIEEGKTGLEDAVVEYEKGMKLIRHCRSILDAAEARVQQLQVAEDGKLASAPMTPPAE
jgi:exodeoxyribonuclease VII small subunit